MEISMMVVVAVFTATILIGQHYFPWRRLLGKDLPRVAAYVMGVLAMLVPLTLLFLVWGWMQGAQALHLYGWAVAAMWLVAVSGGAAVALTGFRGDVAGWARRAGVTVQRSKPAECFSEITSLIAVRLTPARLASSACVHPREFNSCNNHIENVLTTSNIMSSK